MIRRLEDAKLLQEQLFGELQHRVANNLQVVAALIHNARRRVRESPMAAEEALTHAERRIYAMSELHRRLYKAQVGASELTPVLEEALSELFRACDVELQLDIRANDLSVDQMTLLVLLVHEAATNAAKHVFRPGLGKRFRVSLSRIRNGPHQLVIEDDGSGIKRVESEQHNSLGMGIMDAIARQLGGSLDVLSSDEGTMLTVEFWGRPSDGNG